MNVCIPGEKNRVSRARAELHDKIDALLFDAYIPEHIRVEILAKVGEHLSKELIVGGLGKFPPLWARNSAGPECLSSKQEVAGSSPAGPTIISGVAC